MRTPRLVASVVLLAFGFAAGLVLSEKEGRTRRLYFNLIPIQQIYDRWTTQYGAFFGARMADIQARVEARANRRKDRHA